MWQRNVMILKKVVKVHHSEAERLVIFGSHLLWQAGGIPHWSITIVTGLYYTH